MPRSNTFRPTTSGCHEQKTSIGAADAQAFTAAPFDASAFLVTVQTTACYITFDGTTPSSTNGLFLPTGIVHFLPIGSGKIIPKVASSAGANSIVNGAWIS